MFLRRCMLKSNAISTDAIEQGKRGGLAGFGMNHTTANNPADLKNLASNVQELDKKMNAMGYDISSIKSTLHYLSKRDKLK